MSACATMFVVAILLIATATATLKSRPITLPVEIVYPQSIELLDSFNGSALYHLRLPETAHPYEINPYVLKLKGTRYQVGYAYAALMANATSYTYTTFLNSLTHGNTTQIALLENFTDWIWDSFYLRHIPQGFLAELDGMKDWWSHNEGNVSVAPHVVSRRFCALANMPADAPNIISAIEQELERGWPQWLKDLVNEIIYILEHYVHSCDAYGVWGTRTDAQRLYTSRNLDYNRDTGINRYKLVTFFDIQENGKALHPYATMGFAFGLGALAGQNVVGVTTSEMNLDNSDVTFSGLPFPLRLRHVLEHASNLTEAMTVWNNTNNTNSFNFLIGSAVDNQAFALETMMNFTAVFPANSPVEASATYNCGVPPTVDPTCPKWTNQTGNVSIGFPVPDAVWRTNHGMNPRIMATQEPLFNDTIFRYNLLHKLITEFSDSGVLIADRQAVEIVATLGTKGDNYFTCEQSLTGDNVLSVAYVPGEKRFFVAFERGTKSTWRPAACAPYVSLNFTAWF